ncbi:MAG TPA: polysaccharide deacetylase family protein [Armatimonadota bacterium]|nr:polysaccharide deacetylase family protein [Armatimonadota bacterium]
MGKVANRLVPTLLLLHLFASPQCTAGYLATVREAVSSIESGAYDKAAATLEGVSALDDMDLLGRKALGVIYLHTERLDQAESEFRRVAAVEPQDWQAHYALGLIDTVRKRAAQAKKQFELARQLGGPEDELAALELYLEFISGKRSYQELSGAQTHPVTRQTAAVAALKAGKRDDALALMSDILRSPARPGFEEARAPLVTFDPKQPIALPKGKLTWKPTSRKKSPVVSGVVTLSADASRAVGVEFVMFHIDNDLVGITNCEPFQFSWDTTRWENGLHQVTIEGKDQFAVPVSKKSVWVRVSNSGSEKAALASGSDAADVDRRLWACIRLTESRKLAHYHLAKLYLESGDAEGATNQLECVVAYQPGFLDARKQLNKLRGRQPKYVEVYQGRAGLKRIALTFDDGPNERTAETLEMLAKLGVRATFFVVGFRAEAQPGLVKAIQAAGHQVESHTYTHTNLTDLTADQVEAELSKASAVVRAITGRPSSYFRAPGGHVGKAAGRAAARQGFTGVFWTVNCSPYEGESSGALASHVISSASDGGIVLMHNGEPAGTAALPRIVKELRRQGYQFVTISELLASA